MKLADKKLMTMHECEYCQIQVWELSDLDRIHKCSACGDKTDFDDPDILGEWYCHSCGNGIVTDIDG